MNSTSGDPAGFAELAAIADELYAATPAEFTALRDARARELKAADPRLSVQVKALRKPTVPAWAVNVLVRREGEQIDEILAIAQALREAQAGAVGEELRTLNRQRRQLTAALTSRARGLAADYGQKLSPSAAESVETTLTAALLDADAAKALRSGLLIAALTANGVDPADVGPALAVPEALGFRATPREEPRPGPPVLSVVANQPDPAELLARRIAEAEESLTVAQADWEIAGAELAELTARRDAAQAEALQVQAELEELSRRAARLEAHAEEIDETLAELNRDRVEAATAESRARASRDLAQQKLEDLRRG